ncbi:hypothetical protein V6N13_124158 [Hibiscus sabdariffa]
MQAIQDLIDEAKVRSLWLAMVIFIVTFFLSHTSKSMWMNLPIAIIIVSIFRIVANEVEFKWKVKPAHRQTYLSHLEKKLLSVNDSRLSSSPPPPKWKQKIDSPTVEAALNEFIDKILRDFVINMWYSEITPDRDAPELVRAVILDAIAEISGRVKEINLVDLLTRDIIDLIGDHLDLYRRNQAAIGVDVIETLSSEERDERLKHYLMVSEELHPALISPESEYKVIQQLIGGILEVVLRPQEAQCPLVQTIAREIVTCLIVLPLLHLASPGYINEVIEYVLLAIKDDLNKIMAGFDQSPVGVSDDYSLTCKIPSLNSQETDLNLARIDNQKETYSDCNRHEEESVHHRPTDWARKFEAATQRRTEVLAPENLENMWTKGRNYKKKESKYVNTGCQESVPKGSETKSGVLMGNSVNEFSTNTIGISTGREEKSVMQLVPGLSTTDARLAKSSSFGVNRVNKLNNGSDQAADGKKSRLKRSSSTSDLKVEPDTKRALNVDVEDPTISECHAPDFDGHGEENGSKVASNIVLHNEGTQIPKLRCRVSIPSNIAASYANLKIELPAESMCDMGYKVKLFLELVIGAYFEKLPTKSFAVYSIAVTDVENRTWFVERRYRNFEQLHRYLKEIPNYSLHLPPKRIFSSSTEVAFVHQRYIQLDKYLQDLLSMPNVAEQHEVWDFLSVSSKNYSFGTSSSVMKTLAGM